MTFHDRGHAIMPRGTRSSTDDRPPAFVSERQLARRWGVSMRTLQRWRAEHYGPAFMRIGGSIRYALDDVLRFEAAMRSDGGGS